MQQKVVIILGKSIVVHESNSALGFYRDWQGVPCAKEKDLVHLIKASVIKLKC